MTGQYWRNSVFKNSELTLLKLNNIELRQKHVNFDRQSYKTNINFKNIDFFSLFLLYV